MEPEKPGLWQKTSGHCYIARTSQLEYTTRRRTSGFGRHDSGVDLAFDDCDGDSSEFVTTPQVLSDRLPSVYEIGASERNVASGSLHNYSSIDLLECLPGDIDWVSSQPFVEDTEPGLIHPRAVRDPLLVATELAAPDVAQKRNRKRFRKQRRQRRRCKRKRSAFEEQAIPSFAQYEPVLVIRNSSQAAQSLGADSPYFFVDVTPTWLDLGLLYEEAECDYRSGTYILEDTSQPSQRCYLLELPVELRRKIYSFNLKSACSIDCPKLTTPYAFEDSVREAPLFISKPALGVNVLQTCRQMYEEASQLLYDENHFVAHLDHHQDRITTEFGRVWTVTNSSGTTMHYKCCCQDVRDVVRCHAKCSSTRKETLRHQEFDLRRALWHFHPHAIARMAHLTVWMKLDRQDLGLLEIDWSVLGKTRALKTLGIAVSIRDIRTQARHEYASAFASPNSKLYDGWDRAAWVSWQLGGQWHNGTSGVPWQRIFGHVPVTCDVYLAPFDRATRLALVAAAPGSVFVGCQDLALVTERCRGSRGWAWAPETLQRDAPEDENLKGWMARYVGRCGSCGQAKHQRCAHRDEDSDEREEGEEGDSGTGDAAAMHWLQDLRAVSTTANLKSKYETLAAFSRGEARPSNVGDDVLLRMNRALVLRQKELKVTEWLAEIDALPTVAEAEAHRRLLLSYGRTGEWPYMMDQGTWRMLQGAWLSAIGYTGELRRGRYCDMGVPRI